MLFTASDARAKVKVGWFYARCCIEDLDQIKTADELADVLEDYTEDVDECGGFGGWAGFWENRDEAVRELREPR